ncbi:MAG: hypothetical protein KKE64_05705, partial [Candidatus Omnitrophica bacterium]|nr:hypothetical protein [Candidatus Omnitrophota bacterium]
LPGLVQERFQLRLSKSSINAILKNAGLSQPVGRRGSKKRTELQQPVVEDVAQPLKKEEASSAEQESLSIGQDRVSSEQDESKIILPSQECIPASPEVVTPEPEVSFTQEVILPQKEEINIKQEIISPAQEVVSSTQETPSLNPEITHLQPEPVFFQQEAASPQEEHTLNQERVVAKPIPQYTFSQESAAITRFEVRKLESQAVMLLGAIDSLIGGCALLAELAEKQKSPTDRPLIKKMISCLFYFSLFNSMGALPESIVTWDSQIFTRNDLNTYSRILNQLRFRDTEALSLVYKTFNKVKAVKVEFSDNTSLFLDPQMHSVWSNDHIPEDFSSISSILYKRLKGTFENNLPLILQTAPGYEKPIKEFFYLLKDELGKDITKISFLGDNLQELENYSLAKRNKPPLIFAFWPWQFQSYRKVTIGQEFKPINIEALGKQYYGAEISIDLLQPELKMKAGFKGVALKKSLTDKILMVILTNDLSLSSKPQELIQAYFAYWPNLEEGFKDYGSKIELFTYASSFNMFSVDILELAKGSDIDMQGLLSYYIKVLDLYLRSLNCPIGYDQLDFLNMAERFYQLNITAQKQNNCIWVKINPPVEYPYPKELEYIQRRLNEKGIQDDFNNSLRFSL